MKSKGLSDTDGFTDALAKSEYFGFWSPSGKDFEEDVSNLEKLAICGNLRDDATGICLQVLKVG